MMKEKISKQKFRANVSGDRQMDKLMNQKLDGWMDDENYKPSDKAKWKPKLFRKSVVMERSHRKCEYGG